MQSDFELMEYARERKAALRKNGLIMLAAGFLLIVLIQMKLVVGWMVMLIFVMVFVLGIVQPIRYRLKHHPFRAEQKEKRFARALLFGCTIGFSFLFASAVLMGMDGDVVYRASRACVIVGVMGFCTPIFFSYKTL
jgi:Ca2+/Na+ antiporter